MSGLSEQKVCTWAFSSSDIIRTLAEGGGPLQGSFWMVFEDWRGKFFKGAAQEVGRLLGPLMTCKLFTAGCVSRKTHVLAACCAGGLKSSRLMPFLIHFLWWNYNLEGCSKKLLKTNKNKKNTQNSPFRLSHSTDQCQRMDVSMLTNGINSQTTNAVITEINLERFPSLSHANHRKCICFKRMAFVVSNDKVWEFEMIFKVHRVKCV